MEGVKNIVSYKRLLRSKGMTFNSINVSAYIPNPTENDYKKGYIERYFIQKINDKNATITEVQGSDITNIQSTNYFNFVKVDWKIKGNEQQIKSVNKKSLKLLSEQMPRLSLYLPNLLQFARIE